MSVRFASSGEISIWDSLILKNHGTNNVLQSAEMSQLKQHAGWKIRYIISEPEETALVVQERFIFGIGKLWYIPKGPSVHTVKDLVKMLPELKEFARKHGVFVIKIEPEFERNPSTLRKLTKHGAIPSGIIQPNTYTVIIDLSKDLEEMMSNLPQNTRHAIRRAGRDGISIKNVQTTEKNLQVMYDLMSETMSDKPIHMRDKQYYFDFWKEFAENGMGALFIAYDKKTPIAGAYVLKFGANATYKDGGSLKKKTIYGASQALQWHIMEWLKSEGITSYDLCGTPPADEIANPNHPHYGIGLFKTSFKKQITEYVGVFDIVINQNAYDVWTRIGERVVFNIYSRILKKYFY